MRSSGLRNRFSAESRSAWLGWHSCLLCRENGWTDLHHVISPSLRHYRDGSHNQSILNSCPIHNQPCHVGNEATLGDDRTVRFLLRQAAISLASLGYVPRQLDRNFVRAYCRLYDEDVINWVCGGVPLDAIW